MKMNQDQIKRYSRHLILPEVGIEGQEKLLDAKVLIIGAGGLGCPLGLYFTAAGIGTIGIVDFDKVDLSNLQRQVLYQTDEVGQPKVTAATKRLKAINPDVNIIAHETKLTSENALDILKGYDYIVDGTDNFATRYLVNDASVLLNKINVYGSIFRFEGQSTVFGHKEGPCYRCLYPEPPPPGEVPSCAEGGVIGILPGMIGLVQANETVKLILGVGQPLVGRLLVFDALGMKWRELKIQKDPKCPLCGNNRTITQLIDYEQFCGIRGGTTQAPAVSGVIEDITATELKGLQTKNDGNLFILDVREPGEYQIAKIEGSTLIPLREIPNKLSELESHKDKLIVAHCHHGARSAKAIDFLQGKGFSNLKNLKGGIDQWSLEVDAEVPRY